MKALFSCADKIEEDNITIFTGYLHKQGGCAYIFSLFSSPSEVEQFLFLGADA